MPGEKYWVLGIINRKTKELRLMVSKRRTAEICSNFILENVLIGTTLFSDELKGYVRLNSLGYNHLVVKHKKEFVNSENPYIHIQNIERRWRSLKEVIKGCNSFNYLKKKCE